MRRVFGILTFSILSAAAFAMPAMAREHRGDDRYQRPAYNYGYPGNSYRGYSYAGPYSYGYRAPYGSGYGATRGFGYESRGEHKYRERSEHRGREFREYWRR